MSSRCTPAENSQFAGRWSQPVVRSWSYSSPARLVPNVRFEIARTSSPLFGQRIQQVALRNVVAVGSVHDRFAVAA